MTSSDRSVVETDASGIGRVLVLLDREHGPSGVLDWAAWFATRCESEVIALVPPSIGALPSDHRALGTLVDDGNAHEVIARHATPADGAVVVGIEIASERDGAQRRDERVSDLIRYGTIPVIGVPWAGADREGPVVVGVDGSAPNAAVFRWARQVAARLVRPLVVVHVADPADRLFERGLRPTAEDIAVRHEIDHAEAEFVELVSSDIGGELCDHAATRRASLLVVGVRVHRSLGGRRFGTIAVHAAEQTRTPVAFLPRDYQRSHI